MSKKDIKMIIVDLDGTLLTQVDNMTNKTVQTFKKVVEKGITPVIATGRLEKEAYFAADMIGATKYIITMNGLMIYDYEKDCHIHYSHMKDDSAYKVFEILDNHDVFYQVYANNQTYATKRAVASLKYSGMPSSYMEFYSRTNCFEGNMSTRIKQDNIKVDKMFISIKDDKLRKFLKKEANKIEGLRAINSGEYYLEVLPEGADKKLALQQLSKYAKVPLGNMMAIGDSENDIGMLKIAGVSVAMENGCEDAKKVAQYITASNLNDGVTEAIEKFIFN